MRWFSDWRRARVLRRAALDESAWTAAVDRHGFIRTLPDADLARLRESVILFLHEKSIHGAGGLAMRDEMRVSIAVQACILILDLDLDYFRGWSEVIVYPDEFVAEYEYMDESGVMHRVNGPMAGESWLKGPVILSWADAGAGDDGDGYNVVIHEFAHKIDMLNGDANGFPPLHADMSREEWSREFSAAYGDLCGRLERGEHTLIDPYAADHPAEFFAVLSEAFFECPHDVLESYPGVYRQLSRFYRQDPAIRLRRGNDRPRRRRERVVRGAGCTD
ncbi:MAG: zinc-dependent peptidase [Burkholderiales bacterium]|nr:zinc-dependent peptidase [Burkholderiales bacterium]